MIRPAKAASDILGRFSVQVAAALVIGPAFAWLVAAVLPERIHSPFVSAVIVSVIGFLGMAVAIGVGIVNRDNGRLKTCGVDIHAINHIYRDALSGLLTVQGHAGRATREERLALEQTVLAHVCEKIANLFGNLTGRKCVVTVKLAVVEGDQLYCFTWARSHTEIYREEAPGTKYSLLTRRNTGFDEALELRGGRPSFFFSPDLWADKNYQNERDGWQRLYRSAIVVPIRRVFDRQKPRIDLIGLLCVDTTSANRLNCTYCVEFLAAFADQMYNFLSILRGYYTLPGEVEKAAEAREEKGQCAAGE